jgi:hypothetical protein
VCRREVRLAIERGAQGAHQRLEVDPTCEECV